MKTYIPGASKTLDKRWFVVDASGLVLGRIASRIATVLQGKHRSDFVPHMDLGDMVVVVNSDKVKVTGRKDEQKIYFRHSGFMGGLKQRTFNEQMTLNSTKVVRLAVRNMLPHNALGRKRLSKLKVYAGAHHPHEAQNPQPLSMGGKW